MNGIKTFFAVVSLVLLASPAFSASWLECNGDSGKKLRWSGNSTSARINTISFSGSNLTAAQRGIDMTNTNPSPFNINRTTETGGVGSGNGQNEIYAQNISPPGVAKMRYHCYWLFGWHYGLDEVDIVLDTSISWTSSQAKTSNSAYTGTRSPIDAVIVHEAGHYLGLMHVNSEYNVMGDSWRHHHTNGSTARSYFGEDASHGARTLYGDQSSSFRDVSVSHWRRTGSSGEYSSHGRVRVRNSANNGTLAGITINGEPGFRVTRGTTVRPEFTIENNGKQSHANVQYGIYISTNDTISTSDRRIGGGVFGNIHPANVMTTTVPVYIPTDLNAGQDYWLGIILDENNVISEVSESNNKTYTPVRVQ
ncbi:CARDB domain-containing protein [Teredinibacter waterburyi]|jgi:Matrixin./CARDB.|uniref:CARDB domain-containing protein n=1 Tax=Teredinibacter waterburyi TaxID=1500538 RepID=UPI00165FA360|nr:CARDB domain-containing protein [Teredinibacter waterburyi]